jgi:hypothetical protein
MMMIVVTMIPLEDDDETLVFWMGGRVMPQKRQFESEITVEGRTGRFLRLPMR